MIPNEHKIPVVTSGLRFMQCITEAYGSEKGLELWDQLTSVLDPDVKGQIFFAMITGAYRNRIVLRGRTSLDKVAQIRAIRSTDKRRLGLKEAKDLVELIEFLHKEAVIEVEPDQYNYACQELRAAGFTI